MARDSAGLIAAPPSLATLARQAIEREIMSGRYLPGDRLVEEQLCDLLGVSRPTLREALKDLAHTGLVEHTPRKGVRVMSLGRHDIFEIVTMRRELERMAMRFALPRLEPDRVQRCRDALAVMHTIAEAGQEAEMVAAGFDFHCTVVGLAGHQRIETTYRAMATQLQLCMAMNTKARRDVEDLAGNVARHEHLLEIILAGDPEQIDEEFDHHGNLSFLLDIVDQLDGRSPDSDRWIAEIKKSINT